jgi:2-iminobutanoate/2-iminopropanoate deaminase
MSRRVWIAQVILSALVGVVAAQSWALAQPSAPAQQAPRMEKEVFNYGTWETGVMFSQGVSVRNPGRWLFLSGVGAEEDVPFGGVEHPGDFLAQCAPWARSGGQV